ncbi:hypothetical protein ABH309_23400 [Chromobacterium piscinae]|uniref:Uncharacterized protein n=1 Tax=Chromobacterium piscinae TaxID=686831 RepID=A0ABV0HBE0_9NEIS
MQAMSTIPTWGVPCTALRNRQPQITKVSAFLGYAVGEIVFTGNGTEAINLVRHSMQLQKCSVSANAVSCMPNHPGWVRCIMAKKWSSRGALKPLPTDPVYRFEEMYTKHLGGLGLGAAINYISGVGISHIAQYDQATDENLWSAVSDIRAIQLPFARNKKRLSAPRSWRLASDCLPVLLMLMT